MKQKPTVRIAEGELILPALHFIYLSENGSLDTTMLQQQLRQLMHPVGEDSKILSGRQDDKFSQKVRNLVSHRTLDKKNYAKYKKDKIWITKEGVKYLKQNIETINYIVESGKFNWNDKEAVLNAVQNEPKKRPEYFAETDLIIEGLRTKKEVEVFNRSKKLRDIAIDHYSVGGKIYCDGCKFNFVDFYGELLGKRFIEIHHLKPIFQFEKDDVTKTIEQALPNVAPVCSNCHRMIHKKRDAPLSIPQLRTYIEKNGTFPTGK